MAYATKVPGVSRRSPLYDTRCILFHSQGYNIRLKYSLLKKKMSPSFCLSNDPFFLLNIFHLFHLYQHLSLLLLFSSSFSFASLLRLSSLTVFAEPLPHVMTSVCTQETRARGSSSVVASWCPVLRTERCALHLSKQVTDLPQL